MCRCSTSRCVVPLAGDVDRNNHITLRLEAYCVVPLAGDVDRNQDQAQQVDALLVVPLAGDVDRNVGVNGRGRKPQRRPPRGGRG